MWIDVVESGDWIRQLYDVVPPLERITSYHLYMEEGGRQMAVHVALDMPVDHPPVHGYGSNGIGFALIFYGVQSFHMRMVDERMITSAQLERVDGQVVFHGYSEQTALTIVADSVSIRK